MKKLIPTRSDVLGVITGGIAWFIVAVLQAHDLFPFFPAATPVLTEKLKSIGLLKSNWYYAGQPGGDPVAGLTLIVVAIWSSHLLMKHWPSKRELSLMAQIIAKHRKDPVQKKVSQP
jgi:hypothetical protein